MSDNKQWCVYKHTNLTNGKIYIGITSVSPSQRWQRGAGYRSKQPLFFNAIQKHTWDGFRHEVLQPDGTWIVHYKNMPYKKSNFMDQESAEDWERFYIDYYHTFIDDPLCHGYNLTIGGGATLMSEDSRKKMSEKLSLRFENNPELRDAIRRNQQGAGNSMARPIVQFTTDGVFVAEYPTAIVAAKDLNITNSSITSCCSGRCLTAGGFVFLHKDLYEQDPSVLQARIDRIKNPLSSAHFKEIYQFSLNGELINIFSSVKEASEITNINYKSIQAAAAGTGLSGGGFIWRYVDGFEDDVIPLNINDLRRPRAVSQYSTTGEYIASYPNALAAAQALSIDSSAITACCKKNRNYVGGFCWCYADEEFSLPQPRDHRQLYQIDFDGKVIKLWESAAEANRHFNTKSSGAAARGECKRCAGYIWCFRDEWDSFSEHEKTAYIEERKEEPTVEEEIVCVTLNQTFSSAAEAEIKTGVSRAGILGCCKGQQNTSGKMIWCFKHIWDAFSDEDKQGYVSSRSEIKTAEKKIAIINVLTGETFDSCLQAANTFSGKSQIINESCGFGSRYKTSYGQVWCYLDSWESFDDAQKKQYLFEKQFRQEPCNKRSVINVTTGEIFDSLQSACNRYGMTVQALIGSVSTSDSKHKKSANCIWCYHDIWVTMSATEREMYIAAKELDRRGQSKKPVRNVTTGMIYPSVKDAAKETGVNDSAIGMCCNGKRKTAGGFVWAWAQITE